MTQMAAGRPRTDVEPQYVEYASHSSKQITYADTYTVQNVLCSQSAESPTVFHPLESRGAATDRGKDAERERGQPVHTPMLPQTGHDVIRLPVDRAFTLPSRYAAPVMPPVPLPPIHLSMNQLTGPTAISTTLARASTTVASTAVPNVLGRDCSSLMTQLYQLDVCYRRVLHFQLFQLR